MLRTPLVRHARALPLDAVPARSRPLDCRSSCRPANRPCRPGARWHTVAGTTLGAMQGGAAKFNTVDEYAERAEHGSSMAPTSTSDDAAFGSESLNRAMLFALATAPSLVALAVRCLASSLPAPPLRRQTRCATGANSPASRPLPPAATSTQRQGPPMRNSSCLSVGHPGSGRGLAALKLEAGGVGVRLPLPGPAKGPSAVGAHQPARRFHHRSVATDVKPGTDRLLPASGWALGPFPLPASTHVGMTKSLGRCLRFSEFPKHASRPRAPTTAPLTHRLLQRQAARNSAHPETYPHVADIAAPAFKKPYHEKDRSKLQLLIDLKRNHPAVRSCIQRVYNVDRASAGAGA